MAGYVTAQRKTPSNLIDSMIFLTLSVFRADIRDDGLVTLSTNDTRRSQERRMALRG